MEHFLIFVYAYIGFFIASCMISFYFDGSIKDGAQWATGFGLLMVAAFGIPVGLWWLTFGG